MFKHGFALAFIISLFATSVSAQSIVVPEMKPLPAATLIIGSYQSEPSQLNENPTDPPNPFAAGSWSFQTYGSAVVGDPDHGFMYAYHFGFGYYFVDGLSINFEPLVGYVENNFTPFEGSGIAAGFDLLFRWHIFGIDNNDTFSIYFDGGAGFQLADTNFPSDSHHDFRLLAGFGAQVKIPKTENARILGGARYLHISNAGTSDVNDGLDGAQLYLGLLFNY
ncbi:acyloxyacyl hydrolase [Planctomycetota bacterium]|nr:acyloxyacyl hydrolase [Planctomycetota bacterium]